MNSVWISFFVDRPSVIAHEFALWRRGLRETRRGLRGTRRGDASWRRYGYVGVRCACFVGLLVIAVIPCWGGDAEATPLSETPSGRVAAVVDGNLGRSDGTSGMDAGTPLPPRTPSSAQSPTIPSGVAAMVRTALILGAMIGLLLLANRWLRRKFAGQIVPRLPDGMVELLGRAPFLARQSVVLVRIGPRLLWIAMTPNGPVTLTQFDDPEQIRQILEQIPGKGRSHDARRRNSKLDAPQNAASDVRTQSPVASSFEAEYQRAMQTVRQRAARECEPPRKGGER